MYTIDNVKMQKPQHITHTMPPIVDENCKVLINGSMLSPKSREYECYYGHPQNRFWKVLCALWDEDDPADPTARHEFALLHHIALWNVIKSCDIVGASDSTIKNVEPNDMNVIFQQADIQAVFNLGMKANDLYEKHCLPQIACQIPNFYLPSTSPANAAMKFDTLLDKFSVIRDIIDRNL